MEITKVKVAVDSNNNVIAFKYQSAAIEVEVEEYNPDYLLEPIRTQQGVCRFYVEDGEIIRRTDEQCKAQPEYNAYQAMMRHAEYVKRCDGLCMKAGRLRRAGQTAEAEALEAEADIQAELIQEEYPYYEG